MHRESARQPPGVPVTSRVVLAILFGSPTFCAIYLMAGAPVSLPEKCLAILATAPFLLCAVNILLTDGTGASRGGGGSGCAGGGGAGGCGGGGC